MHFFISNSFSCELGNEPHELEPQGSGDAARQDALPDAPAPAGACRPQICGELLTCGPQPRRHLVVPIREHTLHHCRLLVAALRECEAILLVLGNGLVKYRIRSRARMMSGDGLRIGARWGAERVEVASPAAHDVLFVTQRGWSGGGLSLHCFVVHGAPNAVPADRGLSLGSAPLADARTAILDVDFGGEHLLFADGAYGPPRQLADDARSYARLTLGQMLAMRYMLPEQMAGPKGFRSIYSPPPRRIFPAYPKPATHGGYGCQNGRLLPDAEPSAVASAPLAPPPAFASGVVQAFPPRHRSHVRPLTGARSISSYKPAFVSNSDRRSSRADVFWPGRISLDNFGASIERMLAGAGIEPDPVGAQPELPLLVSESDG